MADKISELKQKKSWNRIAIWIGILELAILYMADKASIVEILQIIVLIGGITSYRQIKKSGERGKWISIICIFLAGLAILAILTPMLFALSASK